MNILLIITASTIAVPKRCCIDYAALRSIVCGTERAVVARERHAGTW